MPRDLADASGAAQANELADRKARLSDAKRALLDKWLSGGGAGASVRNAIPKADRTAPIPASFSQEQFWFLDRYQGRTRFYNVGVTARLTGDLDRGALADCLDEIMRRHEALRTTFVLDEGGVLTQSIAPECRWPLQYEDLTTLADGERESQALQRCDAVASALFDLATGPLARAALFRVEREAYLFVLSVHHVNCDGWAMSVLVDELAALYRARTEARSPPLPALSVQYPDFAVWQRETLSGQALDAHLAFWRQTLAGAPLAVLLPVDRPGPQKPTYRGDACSVQLRPDDARRLRAYCQRAAATPFTVLLSALAATLFHWTGQADMVIGTVIANRLRPELERLIGCFVNFLPLRVHVDPECTTSALVSAVSHACELAYEHQDCPFEKIAEASQAARIRRGDGIFNVGILLQNYPVSAAFSGVLNAEFMPLEFDGSTLDLRILVEPHPAGDRIRCEYQTDLFDAETARLLLDAFIATLGSIVGAPEAALGSLAMPQALLDRAKQSRLRARRFPLAVAATFTPEPLGAPLAFWMRELGLTTPVTFTPPGAVLQQFLEPHSVFRGNRMGANVALIRIEDWIPAGCDAEGSVRAALATATDELVAAVGACLEHVTPLIVVACPASSRFEHSEEICAVLEEAETRLLRALAGLNGVYPAGATDLEAYTVDRTHSGAYAQSTAGIPYSGEMYAAIGSVIARRVYALRSPPRKAIVVDCDDTLWKGVCGEDGVAQLELAADHAALQRRLVEACEHGMLVCLCSKNNEADVWEVFDSRDDFPLRRSHVAASRINWASKSANLRSLARELDIAVESFIFLDDDPREVGEVAAAFPQVLALNLPRDGTPWEQYLRHVWALDALKTTREGAKRTAMYRNESERRRLAAEAPSLEAFLESLQIQVDVAPLTSEDFERAAELTYRTTQFTLSSRRLGVQEVAAVAADRDSRCLSVRVTDRFGDYGLTGIVVCSAEAPALVLDTFLMSCRVLRRGVEQRVFAEIGALAQTLGCEYVDVPYTRTARSAPMLAFLQSLPAERTEASADGVRFRFSAQTAAAAPRLQVAAVEETEPADETMVSDDPGAWPAEAATLARIAAELDSAERICAAMARQTAIVESAHAFEPPRSALEERIAEIWRHVLGLDRVGIHDDFFEVGGESLRAIVAIEKMEQAFGLELPILQFFHAPTIAACAAWVQGNAGETRPPGSANDAVLSAGVDTVDSDIARRHPMVFELQREGAGRPFFCVHPVHGHVLSYGALARALGRDRPFIGLQSIGLDGERPPLTSIEEMAAECAAAIRSMQPTGPYLIGGYSLGTAIALEAAMLLRAQGEHIALLVSFDDAVFNDEARTDDDLLFILLLLQEKLNDLTTLLPWLGCFRPALEAAVEEYESLSSEGQLAFAAEAAIASGVVPATMRRERAIELMNVMRTNVRALMRYRPRAYDGKVTVLRAREQPLHFAERAWKGVPGVVLEVHEVPGDHTTLLEPEHIGAFAAVLKRCIDRADPPSAAR